MNKKIIEFIIILLVLVFVLKVNNDTNSITVSSFYEGFEIEGDTIVSYDGSGNIIIPGVINGVTITKIGDGAFYNLDITSVVIPDTISEIGDYAFSHNSITYLSIPSSVNYIGEEAFSHNKISELIIEGVPYFGNACFNDNDLELNDAFFYNKDDYSELVSYGGKIRGNVSIPDTYNSVSIKTIGEKAFLDTGIISITIPDSVEVIKSLALSGNYLVEIYLSSNIKKIASDALSNNSYLASIIIDNTYSELPLEINYIDIFYLR